MTEADFRDWVRAQLSGLEGRVRAVEGRPNETLLWPVSQRIQGEMELLAETLTKRVRAGTVLSLAIAFVTTEGVPLTGFAADGGIFGLAGATTFLGLEVLELERQREAEAKAREAAA